jgi:validoxylamine A glucosyltransferase
MATMWDALTPEISVVIPTYNRCELLARTLDTFLTQNVAAERFEVIVSDDGSSDQSREVAESYRDRLRLQYVYQEDLGFRAGAARNNGAVLASAPIIGFVDTGVRVSPGFIAGHLDAHKVPNRVVVGYTYGYNPGKYNEELATLLDEMPLEEIAVKARTKWSFWDPRHPDFALARFDLSRVAVPWLFTWTLNMSVGQENFWAAGGFDEDFHGWGLEDVELGYRLFEDGLSWVLTRDGWAIETPHPRDHAADLASARVNAEKFYRRHPVPAVEMYLGNYSRPLIKRMEDDHVRLRNWTREARTLDVTGEVLTAATEAGAGASSRVLVVGSGAGDDAWPSTWRLVDFDADLVAAAVAAGRDADHAIGLAVPEPDGAFDLVIFTSRTLGLWDDWGHNLLREAERLAPEVWLKPTGSDRLVRHAPAAAPNATREAADLVV